jgi:hypothetical protein
MTLEPDSPIDAARTISLKPMPFVAGPFQSSEEIPPFNAKLHMLLDLDRPSPCPADLRGISGCAVWKLSTAQISSTWTADNVRVVGVQTGVFSKAGAIKATKWKYVIWCLTQLVPDLRNAFRLWLPGEE